MDPITEAYVNAGNELIEKLSSTPGELLQQASDEDRIILVETLLRITEQQAAVLLLSGTDRARAQQSILENTNTLQNLTGKYHRLAQLEVQNYLASINTAMRDFALRLSTALILA